MQLIAPSIVVPYLQVRHAGMIRLAILECVSITSARKSLLHSQNVTTILNAIATYVQVFMDTVMIRKCAALTKNSIVDSITYIVVGLSKTRGALMMMLASLKIVLAIRVFVQKNEEKAKSAPRRVNVVMQSAEYTIIMKHSSAVQVTLEELIPGSIGIATIWRRAQHVTKISSVEGEIVSD